MRYKITRIGLLNFWLYDEEEFDFSDGKLLLRGTNGSGKSVTMQSFIPLILDGNKTPARLDPFGGKDKRIEDYLLGGADMPQKDEATGYLYMEMYNQAKEKYITIGIGLHSRRGKPTEFWGFSLTDGKRIGIDFLLYHSIDEKVPLSKNELRSRLGTENNLVETAKEYKKMVNKLIFGFPNLDMYDEFIRILMQLRSPKLSREYTPTKLMEILSGVLQPLTEDDLRPLSEAIEEMDKTREKIEKLEDDIKQVSNLQISYKNYNETVLYKKADNYLKTLSEYNENQKSIQQLKSLIEEEKNALSESAQEFENLSNEKVRITDKKANMDLKDLDSKVKRLEQIEIELKESENKKTHIQNTISIKLDKQKDIQNEQKSLSDKCYKNEKKFNEIYDDVANLCEEVKFQEPITVLKDLKQNKLIKAPFSELKVRVNDYHRHLKLIREKLIKKSSLEEKRNEHQKKYDNLQRKYQEQKDQITKKEEEIDEALQELRDQFHLLIRHNKIVKMTDNEKQKITSLLTIYSQSNINDAKKKYEDFANTYHQELTDDYYHLKDKITRKKETIQDISTTLEQLKNKKEEEIVLDEEQNKTINYLEENNIPYVHFYKAVEFKDSIPKEQKNKLESVLLSSGILSSMIVSKEHKQKLINHQGRYLFKGTKKQNNLSKYFTVSKECNFPQKIIIDVLESISISSKDQIYLNENGFKLDFIEGYGNQNEAKYIGILLRKKAHEEKIKQTETNLQTEKSLLENLERLLESKKNDITIVQTEKDSFPSSDKLSELDKIKAELIIKNDIISNDKMVEEDIINDLTKKTDELFKELTELNKNIPLPLYLETYNEVIELVTSLNNALSDLEIALESYLRTYELHNNKTEQLSSINENLDELNTDINSVMNEIERKKSEKKDLKALLDTEGYRDLSNTLLKMETRLTEISTSMMNIKEKQGQLKTSINNHEEEIKQKNTQIEITKTILNLREKFFIDEYNLQYVMTEKITESKTSARKVINTLSNRKDSDIDKAKENFYSAYNDYRLKLSDYHLTVINLFEPNDIDNDELKNIKLENRRVDFAAMYQGKKLSLPLLETTLSAAIIENNEIINEQDRHLFEEILLKTVGTKIRERIEASKEWVKKINNIMKDMQSQSALCFKLDWKSKGPEATDEIETKELVRIFQIDASIITKSDSDKLIKHFRSKLKRRVDELMESRDTYANIIFDVLDYRNWFEFKLNYSRDNENMRELTDKVFAVFSGGEKAKTMYIPLFAAVYAKLMGANKDALRVVALDEAFAGVDDNNIREMFGIMGSLDLDYILTSQALWGDYDTVNDLNISELIKVGTVVGIRRYHWNGKTKEILTKREIKDASPIF